MPRNLILSTALLLLCPAVCCWSQEEDRKVPTMSIDEAIAALHSPDEIKRRQGAATLVMSGPAAKAAVPAIIEIIKQQAPNVPVEPMVVLEQLGPEAKDAVPAIVENLEKYAPNVQHSFLHVLFAIGEDGKLAVPSLIKISANRDDFHCRYLACRVLGEMGAAAAPAVDALLECLQSDGVSVRRNAARALGRLGGDIAPQAAPALIKAMDDPVDPVREEAVRALGHFGTLATPAISKLRIFVKDKESTQRTEAALSLWQLTKDLDFILPHMIDHLEHGDLEWEAAGVIAAMGPAAVAAVPALTKALERDESVQLKAMEALGNIGPAAKSAVPALRQLLENDEPAIREVAQQAIDKIEK